MTSFSWKRKFSNLSSTVPLFCEDNQPQDTPEAASDWLAEKRQKLENNEAEDNKGKSIREVKLSRLKFLKNEALSFIERDCPWQAIARWDEAVDIRIYGETPQSLEHEKVYDMKAQACIQLHEWEPAIESALKALQIRPNWWCAHQTLGRAYLGFGHLEAAVKSFSRAVHISPETEELWTEDLIWAADLLQREKSGNCEWKPVNEPEVNDSEEEIQDAQE